MQRSFAMSINEKSILLDTDSYKVSMWKQYPPGSQYVYSYIESRGGLYDRLVNFGLQMFIREVLSKPITAQDIQFADKFWTAHGEPFNRAGWDYILRQHGGYLPLEIRGLDEGALVPTRNVIASIVNTDPEVPWLPTWVETPCLRSVWYMTTVATRSWHIKEIIKGFLEQSGDPESLPLRLHDFGSRGVSSNESACLGGMSHLVNFKGTDTAVSILSAYKYYDADVFSTGFSIPASEHSTITSWGRDREALAYENMVNAFSKPGSVYAVVSDSYDIFNATKIWGTQLRELVIRNQGTLVIRPDSGDPVTIIPQLLDALDGYFGSTVNSKGYKVLNNVRLIWGDGINELSIRTMLSVSVELHGYSADNLSFGVGGTLLQQVHRDTQKFAMKCSAICIDGVWSDVYKDPVTDPGKKSRKGRFSVINRDGIPVTVPYGETGGSEDLLKPRYLNGKLLNQVSFEQVRKNSEAALAAS